MNAAPILSTYRARHVGLAPLVAALTLTAVLTALRMKATVDSDVAWQLWIAGRIADGAQLYRDIIEVNPPLWFWLARPVDGLARLMGANSEPTLIVFTGILVGLSLAATNKLISNVPLARRTLLLLYASALLIVWPWVHAGQREQIVLVTSIPYTVLVSRRQQSGHISTLLAAAIGAGAAIGFALKPYFLLVPILLELWLVLGRRARWRIVRPETVAIACVGIIYASAMLFWAGAYLKDVIPLVLLAYGSIGARSTLDLMGPSAVLAVALLCIITAQWRVFARGKAPVALGLFIAAFGFTLAYFLQGKGWPYQAMAMVGCASLSLAAMLAEATLPSPLLRLAAPALLAFPLVLGIDEGRQPDEARSEAEAAVHGLSRGQTVAFLTTDNATPWSVTLQHGFRYPSRYMSYWMLNAVVRNELAKKPDARLQALGRSVVSQTVEDYRCAPPTRIVVAGLQDHGAGFDILRFFLRDPQFRAIMAHYRQVAFHPLQVFDRVGPPGSPPQSCRGN